MIPGDSFTISSSMGGFAYQEPNLHHLQQQILDLNPDSDHNPNAKPNSSSVKKKKRNQPVSPDPDADVIALSPTTLMATNSFVCEICNKGFQRDQNLQLHLRGHNLPKQRSNEEVVKKKVYICPIDTCVHHDASKALGLAGIKKHYSRQHGVKNWKCEKCSKKYDFQSDWKAHEKTCATREYKCDCGTLFSRRDSFIVHRAFCDALTQESSRVISSFSNNINPLTISAMMNLNFGSDSNVMDNLNLPHGFVHHPDIEFGHDLSAMHPQGLSDMVQMTSAKNHHLLPSSSSLFDFTGQQQFQNLTTSTNPNLTLSLFSSTSTSLPTLQQQQTLKDTSFSQLLISSSSDNIKNNPLSLMSATSLLQKTAQMGSTRRYSTISPSFFAGPTIMTTSSPPPPPPPRSSSPIMRLNTIPFASKDKTRVAEGKEIAFKSKEQPKYNANEKIKLSNRFEALRCDED